MNEEVQKKKRLNRKSKKLIIVLFFSMAFFVVITYAWFIGLSVAKVNTFEIKISANEGLSLSLDGLNFYDEINLGNTENEILETVLNAYPGNPNSWLGVTQTKWNAPGSDETTLENKKTTDLLPVSTNGLIDQNGSVLTLFSKSSMTSSNGGYALTSDRYLNKIDASGTYLPDEQKGYITFNLFIKNNDNTKYINAYNMFNDEAVYLSTDSSVSLVQSSEYEGESTGGDGLENSLRIAFMQIGRVDANSTQDVVTSITCTTTNIVTGLCNVYSKVTDTEQPDGTHYQKDTDVYESNFNTFAIWEPNDLLHTDASREHFTRICKNRNSDGSYTSIVCGYNNEEYINTYVVREKIDISHNVDIYDGLNTYDANTSDTPTKKLQQMRYYTDTYNRIGDTRDRLFMLAPNSITLVKVYIYLEGQDIDNYDIGSLGKSFAINFGFTKDKYEEESPEVFLNKADSLVYNIFEKETNETLISKMKASVGSKSTPNFTNTATTDEGLFTTRDDYGTSYYYRGAVTDNNIIFAGFCWKAIRITGNNAIKIIYDGVPNNGVCNNTGASETAFRSSFSNYGKSISGSGYMYNETTPQILASSITNPLSGSTNAIFAKTATYDASTNKYTLDTNTYNMDVSNFRNLYTNVYQKHYTCGSTETSCSKIYYVTTIEAGGSSFYYIELQNGLTIASIIENQVNNPVHTYSSTVKTKLDSWYQNNLLSYKDYISDVVYCNDNSVFDLEGWIENRNNFKTNITYNAKRRIDADYIPSLICPRKVDSYTVSDSKGNKDLTYPIGLITADELSFAGAIYNNNANANRDFYLYTGVEYGTMSANVFLDGMMMTYVEADGGLYRYYATSSLYERPVIALKPSVKVSSGDGTKNNPYIIETN